MTEMPSPIRNPVGSESRIPIANRGFALGQGGDGPRRKAMNKHYGNAVAHQVHSHDVYAKTRMPRPHTMAPETAG